MSTITKTETDVRPDARAHLRAMLNDALLALSAIDAGDFSGADAALKRALYATDDCRRALQPALAPPPKAQVDAALKEFRL